MNAAMTSVQREYAPGRWRMIPLPVKMMFIVAGALFAMALTMMGVQAQTTQSNTVCLPVALPLSGAETRAVNSEPTLNFDGSRASFWSTANPVGNNMDRSIEIFVADTSELTGTTAPPINQVTTSRGNILGGFNVMPDMLTYVVGGTRHSLIVFASDRDYEPANSTIKNPDGGFEIFIAQTEPTLKIWQLTDTSRSASIMPTISNVIDEFNGASGRWARIAYLSDADGSENIPRATNNADRNYEVHTMLVNLTPLELPTPGAPTRVASQDFQLTRTSLDTVNDQPTVSARGTHVVFLSNASAGIQAVNTLSNADRNREVFVSTVASAPTVIQVTKSSAGDNDAPDINENGTRVAFASTVTNYPLNAATPGTQAGAQSVYLARLDSSSVTGFSRISSAVRAPNGNSAPAHPVTAKEPALSNDGRRVVFSADGCDPSVTANNCNQPEGVYQVFVVDQQTASQTAFTMARVTNSVTRTHELPSVSGNGQRIALVTTQESSVVNPDLSGSEIVALECRQALLGASMTMNTVSPSLLENRPDVGDTVAFQVTLENTTFADFGGTMVMTNTLPIGLTFLNAAKVDEPDGSAINIGVFNAATRKLVWTVDDLPKLTNATIEIRARVDAGHGGLSKTNVVNISTAADLEAQGITNFIDSDSVDFRVTQVDLRSSLNVNDTLPREGEVYTYTISVTNPLTAPVGVSNRAPGMDPATKVTLTTTLGTLLDQMEYVGNSSTNVVGGVAYNSTTGVLTIDRINPGTTAQVRIGIRPLPGAGGQAPRTVAITGIKSDQEDIANGNNLGLVSRTIRVIGTDLASLTLVPNQTIPPQGSTIVYAFTIRNRGPLPNTSAPPTDGLATGANADSFAPPWVNASAVFTSGITITGVSDGGVPVVGANGTQVSWTFAGDEVLEIGENHTLFITGTVVAAPGRDLLVQAGNVQAFFDPSGLQGMNDPAPGNNGLVSNTVKVNSTAQIGNLTPPDIDEGRAITLTVRYTDADIADTHTIVVNWGDGSANNTSPTLTRTVGSLSGQWVVRHDYADDPPGIGTQNYTLGITVTDNTGNAVISTPSLEVRNVKPRQNYFNISGHVGMDPLNPTAYLALVGQPISMTVRFTDTGYTTAYSSERFSYTVTSGFPEPNTTTPVTSIVNGSVGTPTRGIFSLQRTYNELRDNPFLLNIYVADDDMALTDNDFRTVRLVVDQRPIAHDDYVYLYEGDNVNINVLDNDTDNHQFSLTKQSHNATGIQGTLNSFGANGVIDYTGNVANLAKDEIFTDTVTYVIVDDRGLTATAKVYFVVTGVNEAPIVDLNGEGEGIDISRSFVEDTGNLTLAPDGTVFDNDGQAEIQWLYATITNPADDELEWLTNTVHTGVISIWNEELHLLTIQKAVTDTTPNWNAVLRSIQYVNDSPDPTETNRFIEFYAFDQAEVGGTATATVSVQAQPDAPNIVLNPVAGTANEGALGVAVDSTMRISDTDTPFWGGGQLTATVASAAPQDRLSVVTGGLVTVESANISYNGDLVATMTGANSGQVVITFFSTADNAAVQAIARQIFYARLSGPTSPNPRTIMLAARSELGGAQSNTPSRNFTVTYVNDAPVVLLTNAVTNEDTPVDVRGNISVSDSDSGTNLVRMRVQTNSGGTLSVSSLGSAITGNNTNNVLITNTITALDTDGSILFTPAPDFNGTRVITVTVNDLGHSGTGSVPNTTTKAMTVTVNSVNDAPRLTLNASNALSNTTASYNENAGFTNLSVSTAAILDVDGNNLSALTVTLPIANPGQEFLRIVGATGVITSYNPSTGILSISGVASRAIYQAWLRTLSYRSDSDDPGTQRILSVVVVDNGTPPLPSPTRTITLTIVPNNDPPVLDLNGLASGINHTAAFVEDFGAVSVISPTATLLDPDSTQIMSATVRLTNAVDGGSEVLSGTSFGSVTVTNVSNGVLRFTGTASLEDYLTALKSVTYIYNSDEPTINPQRIIEFKIVDTTGVANVTPLPRTTVSITATNDPSQIRLDAGNPPSYTYSGTFTENGPAVLTQVGTGGDALVLLDPDGTTPNFRRATVTISNLQNGSAETLEMTGAANFNSFYNGATGTLHITSTLMAGASPDTFRNRLRTIRYNNTSDTPGTTPREILFQIWDVAGVGSVPITSTISIVPFNDPPTVTLTAPAGVTEDTPIDLQSFIQVGDLDSETADVTLTITVTNGTLNVTGSVDVVDNGTDVIQATGTITEVNASAFVFSPVPDLYGTNVASIAVRINDNGNFPAPAKSAGAGPVSFSITAVNDGPSLNSGTPAGVSEDVAINIRPFFQMQDIDAESNPVRMRVTVASGVLTSTAETGMVSAGNGTSSVVMTASMSIMNNNVLTFRSAPNMNGSNTITVTVNDLGSTGGGELTATTGGIPFNVGAVNDAPVVGFVAPGAGVVMEDVTYDLAQGLAVSDVDSDSNLVRMRVKVASGTLTVSGAGLTGQVGTPAQTVLVTGTISSLDAAVVDFLSAQNISGSNSFTVTVNDLGFTGSGGPGITTVGPTPFNVNAVNDPPDVAFTAPTTVTEDVVANLGNYITVSDIDAGANPARMRVAVSSGTITISGAGVTGEVGVPAASRLVTGTMSALDGATINFLSAPEMNGTVAITITVNDRGFTGLGSGVTTHGPVNFTVNAVDDAPTLVTNSPVTITHPTTPTVPTVQVVTATNLNATDIDSAPTAVLYTVQTVPGNAGVSLNKSGTPMAACATFTQQEIADGLITAVAQASVAVGVNTSMTLAVGNAAQCVGGSPATFDIRVR